MILKWILLNLGITFMIIILVGFSIKEFACYQFNVYSESTLQSEQFRRMIEEYLLYAGIIAFFLAVLIHLFFARKILSPLSRLTRFSKKWDQQNNFSLKVDSKDEVGQIANDLLAISNQIQHIKQQRDRIAADFAHELRTPLTTLYGYLEALDDGIFSIDKSIMKVLKNECLSLIQLIEKINEWHRWESDKTTVTHEEIQIKDLLQSEYKILKELGFQIDGEIQPKIVYSDPSAISTILNELLDNVVQYHTEKKVKIEGKALEDHYCISISNRGTAIPKEAEEQLFDRFYRTDPSRSRSSGGCGLGLAIAKQVVSKLNGQIGFYSKDRFHTFWFSIPIE